MLAVDVVLVLVKHFAVPVVERDGDPTVIRKLDDCSVEEL